MDSSSPTSLPPSWNGCGTSSSMESAAPWWLPTCLGARLPPRPCSPSSRRATASSGVMTRYVTVPCPFCVPDAQQIGTLETRTAGSRHPQLLVRPRFRDRRLAQRRSLPQRVDHPFRAGGGIRVRQVQGRSCLRGGLPARGHRWLRDLSSDRVGPLRLGSAWPWLPLGHSHGYVFLGRESLVGISELRMSLTASTPQVTADRRRLARSCFTCPRSRPSTLLEPQALRRVVSCRPNTDPTSSACSTASQLATGSLPL